MKRLFFLLRSAIPRDPTQLLFLAGSLLLFICPQLRCFPVYIDHGAGAFISTRPLDVDNVQYWTVISTLARLPILFAGGAGLFICFWPGINQVRRILGFVCVPAISGIVSICWLFLALVSKSESSFNSVIYKNSHNTSWYFNTVWNLGPAVHMSVLGMALILIFLSRQILGIASLPLSLPETQTTPREPDAAWKRVEILIWISIPGMTLVKGSAFIFFRAVSEGLRRFANGRFASELSIIYGASAVAILAGVAAWSVGETRWKEMKQFVRLATLKLEILGAAIPVAVNWIPNLLAYIRDRIQWTNHEFGSSMPPHFTTYFPFPDPFYFWYLLGAGSEEIIWRGYLHPRFIRRYGVTRGILLIGLSWSASHFLGDFQRAGEDYEILVILASRLSLCISMSYVLGWLTLRSGSIWPAVLAHGLNNAWALSSVQSVFFLDTQIPRANVAVCYGILGYVLFKYWPPPSVTEEAQSTALSEPQVSS